ncbi:hypothetical protein K443DRAFT_402238 [Laccaria amethystina LaAM-08-1]|uniref:Unplaced genomic scaffold K443scaffold_314, whole genome shotgun sequence n=1 Tax=Laccaria amethystina LaAM-08-1 TaxID=1095629 RepID=A0A0C9XAP9_9AGAR|nr:hypothetical protein K443DRAFT_402238 [Laccaria amethystina LaAM-08-1]
MHIPSVLSSVVLLLATSLVSASDICAYTDRACMGTYSCCLNVAKGACCSWRNNFGWSVKYQNMPASWFGRAYSDSTCQRQAVGISPLVIGPLCTSVLNNVNANWLSAGWGPGGGIPRRDTEDHVDDLNCVRPNVIGFTTEDGKEHLVKVPEGMVDELNEWVKTENFAKLLELESVSGDA